MASRPKSNCGLRGGNLQTRKGVEKDSGEEAEQRDDENGDENDDGMRSNGGSEEE
ncbi:hypothetical protein PAXRUDRAFT_17286 [Paxillus rubicundulus Ve08.2h10]|uniref:Uncharacterized protein n=1 Tax=Paxillus rubicundulus Ve08.2h10 TaxID=930991 RepID=A0A0D0D2K0_9AGAM|nr:hypothetical protein PAXRUDRAFT_17286 [Paxillus rubicundulus Ve08.2h10]